MPPSSSQSDLFPAAPTQAAPSFVVAVIGATGAVGVEMARCLEQRNFPVSELRLLASARSAGKTQKFRGRDIKIQELTEASFEGVQIALFSAGGGISKRYAPLAARAGAIVIDNSSAFRMHDDVPLVVPEINADEIARHQGIIANPNCAAIISILPLWPIHRKNPLQRLQLATYQAASGAAPRPWRNCARPPGRIWKVANTSIRCCRIPTLSMCSATTRASTRAPATTRRRPR